MSVRVHTCRIPNGCVRVLLQVEEHQLSPAGTGGARAGASRLVAERKVGGTSMDICPSQGGEGRTGSPSFLDLNQRGQLNLLSYA